MGKASQGPHGPVGSVGRDYGPWSGRKEVDLESELSDKAATIEVRTRV